MTPNQEVLVRAALQSDASLIYAAAPVFDSGENNIEEMKKRLREDSERRRNALAPFLTPDQMTRLEDYLKDQEEMMVAYFDAMIEVEALEKKE